jgi:hypothetical protein
MNLLPENVGANKKQLMWLGGLLVVLVVVYFIQRDPSSPATTPAAPQVKGPLISRPGAVVPETSSGPKLATRSGRRDGDFHPSIKTPEGVDITKIDPTLRTDLLTKLQKVPLEGGARSVFDWGQAPPPPPPHVDPIKPEVLAAQAKAREQAAEDLAKRKTVPPPPPPIPLKFYGYANRLTGPARQAFFLDGDDIQIKSENDVIRGKYKIIRIGINSAVVEDLSSHDQQTLPLVAEQNT